MTRMLLSPQRRKINALVNVLIARKYIPRYLLVTSRKSMEKKDKGEFTCVIDVQQSSLWPQELLPFRFRSIRVTAKISVIAVRSEINLDRPS